MKRTFFMSICVLLALSTFGQSSQTIVLPNSITTPKQGNARNTQQVPQPVASPNPQNPSQTLIIPNTRQQAAPQMMGAPNAQQQVMPQMMGVPNAQQAAPKPPVGKMYAIKASGGIPQKMNVDNALKEIAPVLKSLPFTTYESIAIEDNVLPWGQETLFPINALYALHATSLGQEQDGSITLRARVEMLQGETYVNALNTEARAVQNKALLFRGMPLGQEELVIVLLVGVPPEDGNQNNTSQDAEPQSEGENQEEKESEQKTEGEEKENKDKQQQKNAEQQDASKVEQVEGESEKPEGTENMEALLESLDNIDQQEQKQERNKRDRIDFKGDWW